MSVELFTRRKKKDFERIVYLYVKKAKNDMPHINDRDTCKLVLIRQGEPFLTVNGVRLSCAAPCALRLSDRDEVVLAGGEYQATVVFFRPVVINDAFSYERIYSGEFNDKHGTSIFQDYVAICDFFFRDGSAPSCVRPTADSMSRITDLTAKMEYELTEQYDGYWPCRSRSYFIELMFQLGLCTGLKPDIDGEWDFTTDVIEYLNNHIGEKIGLSTLTRHFHVNRNYLNNAFLSETGTTCLGYLLSIRMKLAKLWLSETELPVAEIGRRLSYHDQNYFTKVFRRECGMTPTEYRNACAS